MKTLTLLFLFFISGCSDMCGSQLLQEVVSPNGKLRAVSYLYDCGATTDFSTQISILDADKPIDSSGNVFVSEGKNNISLNWSSNSDLSDLLVGNINGLKVYKQ